MKYTKALQTLAAVLSSVAGVYGQGGGWTAQPSPTTQALYGVSFSDPNTWIIVGDGGLILRSSDGGVTWSLVSSPVGDQLRGVSFHGDIGVAVGLAGRVLRSTDGGLSWVQEVRPTTRNLYAVSMGSNFAVLTGEEGSIFVSTDQGSTWSQRGAGTASVLFGVSISGTTSVGVGGQATVVMSVNSGQGWGLTVLGPPQQLFFYGTSFASPTTGWAVGSYQVTGSIIIKSVQSGFVWTAQSAPTTNTLFGVSFASLDTGTAVGAGGTIVHTSDGGTDWINQVSNTSRTLNAVSFADSRFGIAVGDSGTILRTTTSGTVTEVSNRQSQSPDRFELGQNFPNPFNPSTRIGFSMAGKGFVSLKVYDLLGNEVSTLVNQDLESGSHEAAFDGTGMASGVYFDRLEVQDENGAHLFESTRRLVLIH